MTVGGSLLGRRARPHRRGPLPSSAERATFDRRPQPARRQRVVNAIAAALKSGEEITVASIARRAGVDRTFLYRHRDLLEQVHLAATRPQPAAAGPQVSRASLQADLHNAQERASRMAARTQAKPTR
ncbi:DUF6262 family protein [Nonomuraea sp. H19]|uniref:DUF6262 family protein n=1 Tax=Nonomuraea sp. H19 TaxID=3452206 RepID=UPI003F8B28D4